MPEVVTLDLTASDLITSALVDAGVIALGRTPKAAEMAECIRRTNLMLKSWATRGFPWREETLTISGTADVAETALDVSVYDVASVRMVQSATFERPLTSWERDEYLGLVNKAASGNPSIYYFDRQKNSPVLTVWPVPTASYTLKCDAIKTTQIIQTGADYIDVPEEWYETTLKGIASRCARIFLGSTPPDLAAEAARLEGEMFDRNRPSSYFLGAM